MKKAYYEVKNSSGKSSMEVEVEVVEEVNDYGKKRVIITPVSGSGRLQVNAEKVKVK